jgi:class 3 adenylate cyclase
VGAAVGPVDPIDSAGMTGPIAACLLIADISGYTRYLAGVELDHAQDILADLMGTIVDVMHPTFQIANVEGDAVFFFAETEQIDGSILLDLVERTYSAFRDRMMSIVQASICECQACLHIGDLDLKVVVHHGQVISQNLAGRVEVVGKDVIVAHRMLKNTIDQTAYAFLSDPCVADTGLDPELLGMRRHSETYEHVGEVHGWIHDLAKVWSELRERRRLYIDADTAASVLSTFFPASPELVWEHISSPRLRVAWSAGIDRVDQLDPSGRRRQGTISHCMHGDDVLLQEFLDWQPPSYFTSRVTMPGGAVLVSTHEVEPTDGGSILHDRFAEPEDDVSAAVFTELGPMFEAAYPIEVETLGRLLADAMERTGESPAVPRGDEEHRLATAVTRAP